MLLFLHTALFKENLFVKLKNLYTSACSNLNYGTAEQKPKMRVLITTCDEYSHKFNFFPFFQISSKFVPEDLNLKLRSKFNLGFINHGWFHCAILKALSDF